MKMSKTLLCLVSAVSLAFGTAMQAQSVPQTGTAAPAQGADVKQGKAAFEKVADSALGAMKAKAEELKIKGAAVVIWMPGESVSGWESKMLVVGSHRDEPVGNARVSNLIAVAYSKAGEMADTLKDSGSNVRPRLNGELAYKGGLIQKCKTGYLIAAFSGGRAEDDVQVSRAGLNALAAGDL